MIRNDFNWNPFTFNSCEPTFDFPFESQKHIATNVFAHNRVPSKQFRYWGSGSLMGFPPWKIVWVLLLNKGLIRRLNIWETLHFQGFNMDMVFSSKWTSFTQRKVDKRVCFFFSPQKFLCTIGYHRNNSVIEDLGHSCGVPLNNCLGAVFK